MSEKSHVSMEQRVCHVCGTQFDTGAILLDKRLKASLERNTVTGMGTCPDCDRYYKEGRIALVEAKAPEWQRNQLRPDEANRTGAMAWLAHSAFTEIFNVPLPRAENGDPLIMCFVEEGVIAKLQSMIQPN